MASRRVSARQRIPIQHFDQGAAGYGRYYWHTFADQTDENLWVEGILPSVLRQDSRYYTLGHGGVIKRGFYAVSRTLITRTDSGRETFNASEILGAGTAAGISSLYYPTQYRTWTKVGQRWLTNALLDFGTFAAKEFWPDVNQRDLPRIRLTSQNAEETARHVISALSEPQLGGILFACRCSRQQGKSEIF